MRLNLGHPLAVRRMALCGEHARGLSPYQPKHNAAYKHPRRFQPYTALAINTLPDELSC